MPKAAVEKKAPRAKPEKKEKVGTLGWLGAYDHFGFFVFLPGNAAFLLLGGRRVHGGGRLWPLRVHSCCGMLHCGDCYGGFCSAWAWSPWGWGHHGNIALSFPFRFHCPRCTHADCFARFLPSLQKKKDPNAPKRPMSAYMFFSNDARAEVKKENPDFKITDISKALGVKWGGMSDVSV